MASTDDLILFAQVVEAGSFSKVAEQNSLTNSVVSKRIGRLEEELGVQLLYRTTRRLTLSEAGKSSIRVPKCEGRRTGRLRRGGGFW